MDNLLLDALVAIKDERPWSGYADPVNIAGAALAEARENQKQRRLEAALIGLREFLVERGEIFDGGSDGYELQGLLEAADEALAA